MDCRACVKSRYDGRGLECAKMGKGEKEDKERERTSLGMERRVKVGGVKMGKEGWVAVSINQSSMATGQRADW